MTPERYNKILAVLNKRQPDLTVITDNVHKGQNLSAIIRTCDAVGVHRIHAVYETGQFGAHTGTAMGSQKWVETCSYRSVSVPIVQLQKQGFQVLAAQPGKNSRDYREFDFTLPTAILLGAERDGVSAQAKAQVDGQLTIPMMGMVESFNVSVACAVILAEACRQRQQAGMYDRSRLPKDEFNKYLFEWCQPLVARYCQRKGLTYPPLTGEGDIAKPEALK